MKIFSRISIVGIARRQSRQHHRGLDIKGRNSVSPSLFSIAIIPLLESGLPYFTTRRSLQEQLQWEFIFAPFSLCKVQNSRFWQSH